jgi:hypothetical protein
VFRWGEKGAVASRGFLSLFMGKRESFALGMGFSDSLTFDFSTFRLFDFSTFRRPKAS